MQANYTFEGTVLENVESILKYLGVAITNDLKWNTHMIRMFLQKQTELSDSRGDICIVVPQMCSL